LPDLPISPSHLKKLLREQAVAARARLSPGERATRSHAIADRVALLDGFRRARTVALYVPVGAEVDTGEIARCATAAGKTLVWPRSVAGGRKMEFAACFPGDMVPGPMGAPEPPTWARAVPAESIDLIVVPGLAFDASCGRLGRGGGHYDATLAAMPPRAPRVGLAFEAQLVPQVPREAHDVALDAVVTEDRLLPDGGRPR
jgi:5-formyltetrahydrofolate cyclo-ligase